MEPEEVNEILEKPKEKSTNQGVVLKIAFVVLVIFIIVVFVAVYLFFRGKSQLDSPETTEEIEEILKRNKIGSQVENSQEIVKIYRIQEANKLEHSLEQSNSIEINVEEILNNNKINKN
jgi:cell division protein YceG involved in septum cleavage